MHISIRGALGQGLFALLLVSFTSIGTAYAQEPAADDQGNAQAGAASPETIGEVVVLGVRRSVEGALTIKRESQQVVDSIVAEDIGKLPDNNVAEALQRVTGIQVRRDLGEAFQFLIRGLPDVETLMNGREVFTGTGRFIAVQDIPSELLAGVDAYKSSSPAQVEGGVAGLIDIRMHRPFDFQGFEMSGSARAIYSDQADKYSGIGSFLASNRWDTGSGEMGAIVRFVSRKI